MRQQSKFNDSDRLISRDITIREMVCNYFLALLPSHSISEIVEAFEKLWFPQPAPLAPPANRVIRDTLRQQDFEMLWPSFWQSIYLILNAWDNCQDVAAYQQFVACLDRQLQPAESFESLPCYLQHWIATITNSQAYWDLKRFVAAYIQFKTQTSDEGSWSDRYVDSWLMSVHLNTQNCHQQQELVLKLANRIRHQFKLDLALYVARSQSNTSQPQTNPTIFGNDFLRVLKTIVASAVSQQHRQRARVFNRTLGDVNYQRFKKLLQKYSISSTGNSDLVMAFELHFAQKMSLLYPSQNDRSVNDILRLATCNQAIKLFTTEDGESPSQLFQLAVSRGKFLTLVSILSKILLISPDSLGQLDICIAALLEYYEQQLESEIDRIIPLFEILKIAISIGFGDIEYSLVKRKNTSGVPSKSNLEDYQIFTQAKSQSFDQQS
ncbi:MAG: hypothetical protein J7641_11425 [Cyanobacteria bacterium SID2]|nr:hypothetical protein [Cyanobacteria bacterium SID2]MBP0005809.1 hypothetical protein [Cyanobacteria bacterium SBC]